MIPKKLYNSLCALLFLLVLVLSGCGGGGGGDTVDDDGPDDLPDTSSVTQGIVIDPYIVGAVFQEIAQDGTTVLQRQSTASNEFGVFSFPNPLTEGSTIEMKLSSKGLHGSAPFEGLLRRTIEDDDSSSVNVTPLTSLLANGMSRIAVLQSLFDAGFSGLTTDDLYSNPMIERYGESTNDLLQMTSGVTNSTLLRLQANMAVNDYMEITGNFQASGDNLNDYDQIEILSSVADAVRSRLSSTEFSRITTELAQDPQLTGQPTLGDLIMSVLQQQRTLVASTKEQMEADEPFNPTLVEQAVQDGMGQIVAQVKMQFITRSPNSFVPTNEINGTSLYTDNCTMCHGTLATSNLPNRSAGQIQTAIDDNVGNMGSLNTLTSAEIQAIADVLPAAQPVNPVTPPDGTALYGTECAACHGTLANTGKPGRTAADIQAAIDTDVGNMGSLNTLTTTEVQAIADALPAAQQPDPATPPDGVALYNSECAGCHSPLNNTTKPERTATQIQTAIDNNVGNMGSLSTLTSSEVQAIADVLPAAQPVNPVTPPDGTALYSTDCAACHGTLANTGKPGRTASQIQTAIDNNVGNMGYLSTLTTDEVQAIADVLPAAPPAGPDYTNCTACHGQPPSGSSSPDTAGAHAAHASLPSVTTDCGICHVNAAHNGQLDLGFPTAYNAKSGTAINNSNGTCSSLSCHGGQTTPVWTNGNIVVNTQCTSCHASGTTQYNSYFSGRHSKHCRYACTVCHNTSTLQTGHFDNLATTSFEQTPATTIGGGSTSVGLYQSGTCSSISCHGSERW